MQKITPFLWFDTQAEDAAKFYVSIFKNSEIKALTYYGEHGPMPQGQVMTVVFQIEGQEFIALNGGPHYSFTPAVSFVVGCETQQELDSYWDKLTDGGEEVQCGWLKDKYGLSWQIVPSKLEELLSAATPEQSNRVMAAVMGMVKFDMATMQRAYDGQ